MDKSKIYKVVVSAKLSYLYEIAFKTPLTVEADKETMADFWQAPGYTHEQTFNLSAENIKNYNVTFSSDNAAFTVSPTPFTAAQAKERQTVTVTFKPTKTKTEGATTEEYTGNIKVLYNGVEYDNIAVTGKSEWFPVKVTDANLTTLYYDKPLVIPYDVYNVDDDKLLTVEYVSNLNAASNTIDMKEQYPIIPELFGVIVATQEPNTSPGYYFPVYNNYKNDVTNPSKNYLVGTLAATTKAAALQAARDAGYSEYTKILTLGRRAGTTDQYGFYNFTGTNMPANKAYLIYDAGKPSNITFLSLDGSGNEYTAIQEVEKQQADGAWYTVQGVRLNSKPTQQGIYLHNGKKVMVK